MTQQVRQNTNLAEFSDWLTTTDVPSWNSEKSTITNVLNVALTLTGNVLKKMLLANEHAGTMFLAVGAAHAARVLVLKAQPSLPPRFAFSAELISQLTGEAVYILVSLYCRGISLSDYAQAELIWQTLIAFFEKSLLKLGADPEVSAKSCNLLTRYLMQIAPRVYRKAFSYPQQLSLQQDKIFFRYECPESSWAKIIFTPETPPTCRLLEMSEDHQHYRYQLEYRYTNDSTQPSAASEVLGFSPFEVNGHRIEDLTVETQYRAQSDAAFGISTALCPVGTVCPDPLVRFSQTMQFKSAPLFDLAVGALSYIRTRNSLTAMTTLLAGFSMRTAAELVAFQDPQQALYSLPSGAEAALPLSQFEEMNLKILMNFIAPAFNRETGYEGGRSAQAISLYLHFLEHIERYQYLMPLEMQKRFSQQLHNLQRFKRLLVTAAAADKELTSIRQALQKEIEGTSPQFMKAMLSNEAAFKEFFAHRIEELDTLAEGENLFYILGYTGKTKPGHAFFVQIQRVPDEEKLYKVWIGNTGAGLEISHLSLNDYQGDLYDPLLAVHEKTFVAQEYPKGLPYTFLKNKLREAWLLKLAPNDQSTAKQAYEAWSIYNRHEFRKSAERQRSIMPQFSGNCWAKSIELGLRFIGVENDVVLFDWLQWQLNRQIILQAWDALQVDTAEEGVAFQAALRSFYHDCQKLWQAKTLSAFEYENSMQMILTFAGELEKKSYAKEALQVQPKLGSQKAVLQLTELKHQDDYPRGRAKVALAYFSQLNPENFLSKVQRATKYFQQLDMDIERADAVKPLLARMVKELPMPLEVDDPFWGAIPVADIDQLIKELGYLLELYYEEYYRELTTLVLQNLNADAVEYLARHYSILISCYAVITKLAYSHPILAPLVAGYGVNILSFEKTNLAEMLAIYPLADDQLIHKTQAAFRYLQTCSKGELLFNLRRRNKFSPEELMGKPDYKLVSQLVGDQGITQVANALSGQKNFRRIGYYHDNAEPYYIWRNAFFYIASGLSYLEKGTQPDLFIEMSATVGKQAYKDIYDFNVRDASMRYQYGTEAAREARKMIAPVLVEGLPFGNSPKENFLMLIEWGEKNHRELARDLRLMLRKMQVEDQLQLPRLIAILQNHYDALEHETLRNYLSATLFEIGQASVSSSGLLHQELNFNPFFAQDFLTFFNKSLDYYNKNKRHRDIYFTLIWWVEKFSEILDSVIESHSELNLLETKASLRKLCATQEKELEKILAQEKISLNEKAVLLVKQSLLLLRAVDAPEVPEKLFILQAKLQKLILDGANLSVLDEAKNKAVCYEAFERQIKKPLSTEAQANIAEHMLTELNRREMAEDFHPAQHNTQQIKQGVYEVNLDTMQVSKRDLPLGRLPDAVTIHPHFTTFFNKRRYELVNPPTSWDDVLVFEDHEYRVLQYSEKPKTSKTPVRLSQEVGKKFSEYRGLIIQWQYKKDIWLEYVPVALLKELPDSLRRGYEHSRLLNNDSSECRLFLFPEKTQQKFVASLSENSPQLWFADENFQPIGEAIRNESYPLFQHFLAQPEVLWNNEQLYIPYYDLRFSIEADGAVICLNRQLQGLRVAPDQSLRLESGASIFDSFRQYLKLIDTSGKVVLLIGDELIESEDSLAIRKHDVKFEAPSTPRNRFFIYGVDEAGRPYSDEIEARLHLAGIHLADLNAAEGRRLLLLSKQDRPCYSVGEFEKLKQLSGSPFSSLTQPDFASVSLLIPYLLTVNICAATETHARHEVFKKSRDFKGVYAFYLSVYPYVSSSLRLSLEQERALLRFLMDKISTQELLAFKVLTGRRSILELNFSSYVGDNRLEASPDDVLLRRNFVDRELSELPGYQAFSLAAQEKEVVPLSAGKQITDFDFPHRQVFMRHFTQYSSKKITESVFPLTVRENSSAAQMLTRPLAQKEWREFQRSYQEFSDALQVHYNLQTSVAELCEDLSALALEDQQRMNALLLTMQRRIFYSTSLSYVPDHSEYEIEYLLGEIAQANSIEFIKAFNERDLHYYLRRFPNLTKAQVEKIFSETADYIFYKNRLQQTQLVLSKLKKLPAEDHPQFSELMQEIAGLLARQRQYDLNNPRFHHLLSFEVLEGVMLRERQYLMHEQLSSSEDKFFQAITGDGKTTLLPEIIESLTHKGNSPIIIVKESLLDSTRRKLKLQLNRIDKDISSFSFLPGDDPAVELQRIQQAIARGEPLITTFTFIQYLREMFLQKQYQLNEKRKKPQQLSWRALDKSNKQAVEKHMREADWWQAERQTVEAYRELWNILEQQPKVLDEMDEILSALHELKLTMGQARILPVHFWTVPETLIQYSLEDAEILAMLREHEGTAVSLYYNDEGELSLVQINDEIFYRQHLKPLLVKKYIESLLDRYENNVIRKFLYEKRVQLFAFLLDDPTSQHHASLLEIFSDSFGESCPAFLDDIAANLQEELSLAMGILAKVLEHTLKQTPEKDYGRYYKKIEVASGVEVQTYPDSTIAMPRRDTKPLGEKTFFKVPPVTIVLTILDHYRRGLAEDELVKLFKALQADRVKEKLQQAHSDVVVKTEKLFDSWLTPSARGILGQKTKLEQFDLTDKDDGELLFKAFRNNRKVINYFLNRFTITELFVYELEFHSGPHDLLGPADGVSATIGELPARYQQVLHPKILGQELFYLLQHHNLPVDTLADVTSSTILPYWLSQIQSGKRVLIDATGLLTEPNLNTAKWLLAHTDPTEVDAIVFVNDVDGDEQRMVLYRDSDAPELLGRNFPNNAIAFHSNPFIRGVDITYPDGFEALVIIKKINFDTFAQACGRMRRYLIDLVEIAQSTRLQKGHGLRIVIDQATEHEIRAFLALDESYAISLQHVISWLILQYIPQQEVVLFLSALQGLETVAKTAAFRQLLSTGGADLEKSLRANYRPIPQTALEMYGTSTVIRLTLDVLKDFLLQHLKQFGSLLTVNKNAHHILETMIANIDRIPAEPSYYVELLANSGEPLLVQLAEAWQHVASSALPLQWLSGEVESLSGTQVQETRAEQDTQQLVNQQQTAFDGITVVEERQWDSEIIMHSDFNWRENRSYSRPLVSVFPELPWPANIHVTENFLITTDQASVFGVTKDVLHKTGTEVLIDFSVIDNPQIILLSQQEAANIRGTLMKHASSTRAYALVHIEHGRTERVFSLTAGFKLNFFKNPSLQLSGMLARLYLGERSLDLEPQWPLLRDFVKTNDAKKWHQFVLENARRRGISDEWYRESDLGKELSEAHEHQRISLSY
jgi:hypothetical protein